MMRVDPCRVPLPLPVLFCSEPVRGDVSPLARPPLSRTGTACGTRRIGRDKCRAKPRRGAKRTRWQSVTSHLTVSRGAKRTRWQSVTPHLLVVRGAKRTRWQSVTPHLLVVRGAKRTRWQSVTPRESEGHYRTNPPLRVLRRAKNRWDDGNTVDRLQPALTDLPARLSDDRARVVHPVDRSGHT
jgi:hypothetical protein